MVVAAKVLVSTGTSGSSTAVLLPLSAPLLLLPRQLLRLPPQPRLLPLPLLLQQLLGLLTTSYGRSKVAVQ